LFTVYATTLEKISLTLQKDACEMLPLWRLKMHDQVFVIITKTIIDFAIIE